MRVNPDTCLKKQLMNAYKLIAYLFICGVPLLLAISCRKDAPSLDEPRPVFGDPVTKPKGQPVGDAVSTVIDARGGTLWFHGAVRLEIPPGAVEQPTAFGIQPITNTLDEASPYPAFRLTPEGTHFKKPIQVSFLYEPETGGHPQTRMVAFQNDKGIWCGVSTALDETQRQLTVETTHFSDWVWFDLLSLRKDRESVGAGGTVSLKLLQQVLGELVPANHIDSVSLGAMEDIGYWGAEITVSNWKIVKGPGKLEPQVNQHGKFGDALYTAPATVSEATDVEIQVEVESKHGYISDRTAPNGRRRLGKLVLLTKIRLEPDHYFFLEVDGVRQDLSMGASGAIMGGQITVGGANEAGVIVTLSCRGSGSGTYPGGIDAGESFILLSVPSGGTLRPFHNVYVVCPDTHYSGVAEVSVTGDFIEGTFTGMVYYSDQACGYSSSKSVKCTFKIKQHSFIEDYGTYKKAIHVGLCAPDTGPDAVVA